MKTITTTPGIYGPRIEQPEEQRKGALRHALRQARQTLSLSQQVKPRFALELLTAYARHQMAAVLAMPALALITAIAMAGWIPLEHAGAWFSTILATSAISAIVCRQFVQAQTGEAGLRRWRGQLAAAEFLHGTAWGMLALLTPMDAPPAFHVFVCTVLVLVIAARCVSSASVAVIIYAGTLPVSGALVLRLALLDTPFFWALAVIVLSAHLYFAAIAIRIARALAASIAFQAEKEALIADLEQATSQSEEARRRAEEASMAKSRFLATMSHELRTPLNAILGFSEVLKNEVFGPHENPSYKEYAADIHDSGQHLLNLINEVLDLSRIEAGRYELSEEPLRLAHVLEDCLRLVALRAKEKRLEVVERFETGLPRLMADERAVRQICLNLLSNAIKFTPAGGSITLKAGWTEGGGQYISVRDTGPGIPENEIPQILTSFGQGSLAQKTAEQGAGLGLPIVQGLAALHGGSFDLRSKLREGTEVIVTFPRTRNVSAAQTPVQANNGTPGAQRPAA